MYLFYVNMQKRGDGKVYPDLHKTDGKIYFTPEEAQAAIDADPDLAPHRHVVELGADLPNMIPREPHVQVWRATDSCEECWCWDDVDPRFEEVDYASENTRVLYGLPDNS